MTRGNGYQFNKYFIKDWVFKLLAYQRLRRKNPLHCAAKVLRNKELGLLEKVQRYNNDKDGVRY
jgi:hypothetical protein